jgi:hypothetical protein
MSRGIVLGGAPVQVWQDAGQKRTFLMPSLKL